jgi:hypothetical protein
MMKMGDFEGKRAYALKKYETKTTYNGAMFFCVRD